MKKFIFSFILGILFISLVSASSYNLELNQVDDKALVKHSISLDSFQAVSINLPSDAYSISSNSNYALQNNLLTISGKEIEISYLTNYPLEKSKEGYYFVDKIIFPSDFDNVNVNLILKEGYFTDKDKIFPLPSSITSDGSQITISWILQDVKQGDDLPIFIAIKSPSSPVSWILWILVIVIVLFIIYFIYDKFIKSKSSKKEKSPIESHLIESEKVILTALKSADRGEMWQKQLQLKTNFSKAKLSRVIRNLEVRNLVEKIPFGNTNKVRLR